MSRAELQAVKARGIIITPDNAEQGNILKALLEEAKRMPEYELRMVCDAMQATIGNNHKADHRRSA